MRFNEDAELDTSQVDDLRGAGGMGVGGRVALGGGGLGIVGLLIFFLLGQLGGGGTVLPGGGTALDQLAPGQQADNRQLEEKCRTGRDANRDQDCALVAIINSIQNYWSDQFARSGKTYQKAPTNFFTGAVSTGGCGGASSDVGPFYCPADTEVYIDLGFFTELQGRFKAQGGTFVEAYVLAHEYGHHVQKLLGTSRRVRPGETGPTSGAVRLELQADCYAGTWAHHATRTPTRSGKPLITEITQDDVNRALDAAARIGDDYIQKNLGSGRVDEGKFSHGSSTQRQKWFTTGLKSGDPAQCNTFGTADLG
ncbi:membrane protein [Longimycelium tulufanense]|uniref:Membrane protein n=1 Tax=Longimycelium tulufanense TaxID=907463 RepID=A0A8J3C8Y5_9PSEU|nr:neutral zinc metallopeptidase [Longimycelium tulufanense]GGM58278.1 membrane protein [Longimycelium tulufanense]